MSSYVQLGDVHAYFEEDGAGEPLVLLCQVADQVEPNPGSGDDA